MKSKFKLIKVLNFPAKKLLVRWSSSLGNFMIGIGPGPALVIQSSWSAGLVWRQKCDHFK